MKKNFDKIVEEATVFNICVTAADGKKIPIRFVAHAPYNILSWMYYDSTTKTWTGYTCEPKATGTKRGTKAEVADWCLDWAANGF